ncbi:STAS domain-containing protein [Nonomuraea sp. MTCD27]|uniref:STAS domain-containing protein n=1 Tax=Nonomuraea sp. MTCD27 TaxID=1676747 RepID=UPI0035C117A6
MRQPMMQLAIQLVPVGDTTLVIVLTGELDINTRPMLAALLDPIPQSPVTYVVVAAADLWFCDLGGLHQLALTHRALQAKGGHLAVVEARPPLCRLIALWSAYAPAPAFVAYASMAPALSATDVQACQIGGPPAPLPRHLPRVRQLGGGRVLPVPGRATVSSTFSRTCVRPWSSQHRPPPSRRPAPPL